MRRGPYKKYLEPGSNVSIPRTTAYNLKKRKTNQYPTIDSSSDSEQDTPESIQNCRNVDQNFDNQNEQSIMSDFEENITEHIQFSENASNESIENQNEQSIISDSGENPHISSNESVTSNESFWNQFDEVFSEDSEEDDTELSADLSWFEDTLDIDCEMEDSFSQKKLCECTDTKISEAITMVLLTAFKHSWTWESTIDTLSIINSLFGKNIVPTTKHKLFKLFPTAKDVVTYHIYCKECICYIAKYSNLKSIGTLTCNYCGQSFNKSNVSFFLTFNLRNQLRQLLENPEVQHALHDRFQRIEREENVFDDIYDGYMYKKFCDKDGLLGSAYNLSYTFSTDGCQTSKSSRMAAWPIYIMIHELPPKLRANNILMTGLWISDEQPNMNLFLEPFVEEANSLSNEGVQWTLNNEVITSKVLPLCGCFDSAARWKVLNMKQYNGYYGCTFCEHPGTEIDRTIKYTISTQVPEDRTDESIKQTMIDIGENQLVPVRGIKGPSVLINLEYFDLVNGMVPDYMHAVLLGVIKQHTNILLSNANSDYYIGQPANISLINNRLLSIKHPSCITRAPRKIEEREQWKASEWRSWLLFYSLLCFKDILRKKYLHHLALLVSAINLLLSERLTPTMITNADTMLVRYVTLYQKYFSESSMTYNVHLLLHLYASVFNWGPLYTHNAFFFENENRVLLQFRKSPAQLLLQIAKKYFFKKSLMAIAVIGEKSTNFQLFCEQTLSKKLKNIIKIYNVILIGMGKDCELDDTEKTLVNFNGDCRIFNRMIVNGFRYTSELYRKCKKLNDSIIENKSGEIGCITKISYFPDRPNNKIVVFYREILFLTEEPFIANRHCTIDHIRECYVSDIIKICYPDSILKHGFLIKMQNRDFYISIPKGCHDD